MAKKLNRETAIAERRRKVADAYIAGQTQTAIAESLGVNQSTVSRDINSLLEQWRAEHVHTIDQMVAKQLEELRKIREQAWRRWNDTMEQNWMKTIIDVQDREAKLLGLYAPTRSEVGLSIPPDVMMMAQQLGISKQDIVREFEALIRAEAERVNS